MQGSGPSRDHEVGVPPSPEPASPDLAAPASRLPSPGGAAVPLVVAPAPDDVLCTELELSAPPLAQDVGDAATVRVLARLHHIPLGFVTVSPDLLARPEELRDLMLARLEPEVSEHLRDDGLPVVDGPDQLLAAVQSPCPRPDVDDHVSVVIGTRNRAEHVRGCLEQLLRLDYPSFDVTVVENGSTDDDTEVAFGETVGTDSRFRYLNLDQAGVSRARNAGMWAAQGPLVAFIDDDVRVDSFWLQGVARAFRRSPSVVCVTGLIATRSIAGPEQLYFDSRVSWASNLRPRTFHPTSDDPLHPWAAGRFGAGANMAFRLDAARQLRGFDENLGPGTKAKGGEDIDLFVRALRAGGDLAYDPAALAWHIHRSDAAGLEQQMFGYGVGLTAYLTKHAVHPPVALEMLVKVPGAVRHVLRVTRTPEPDGVRDPAARRYRRIELTGMMLGPLFYLRSRLAGRGSSVHA